MHPLQIYDRRERALVGMADRVLAAGMGLARPFRRRRRTTPERILLLRLERIGDLLMALPAIGDVRAALPHARLDIVVGSWNAPLARAIRGLTTVHTLDAAWLSRGDDGLGMAALLQTARSWRGLDYDLAVNFEPDIRSNLLLAAAGARWTVGYSSGGGGPLLDQALEYNARTHTSDNARRLVATALGAPTASRREALLTIGSDSAGAAAGILGEARPPLVGLHASGGREIKQWPPERFAEVGRRLIHTAGATIVLTGSLADRPLVEDVRRMLPAERTIDATIAGDLLTVGAVLERLDVLVTGDTGPMHLAHAIGTPVVAVFGPSDPVRYAPGGPLDRVVRVDLPCAPCNRIRLPPERCIGHTPDCLALVTSDEVFDAVMLVLENTGAVPRSKPPAGTPAGA
ncbi:MAG: glycosyltransferase family 9 protein [Acidobacteria bacterium]|nr:glycosyltransferase family 9 protein [Acidobacteriota bacterium]